MSTPDARANGAVDAPDAKAATGTSTERGRPTRRTWGADLGVLGVAIVWGSTYVAMQWMGQYLSVPLFLFLRFALGALAITVLSLHLWRQTSRDELMLGCLFGGLLFAILFLETLGVRYTLASNAGFLIALSVMLVPLFERLFLRVAVARSIYPLTLLSLTGCALLTLNEGLSVRSGDLIILAAALIRAWQIVLFGSRTKGRPVSLLRVTAIELWVVALGGLLLSLVQPGRSWQQMTQLPGNAWLVIVYLGVAGTAFAFLAQLHAARVSSPTRVGLVLSTEPFFAAVFAVLLLNEHLGPLQLLGGGLVLVSAVTGRWVDARSRRAQ
ncbi:EamA family transporter [Streptomyces sp. TRM43335]|uniref:EamA family transporter n=1 Tax=Streptomyces taklimakanensis TaxID=2569853 RepID=A0A6G2BCH1_9ACTN|nr:DMT family transporter [Streptomyces taklimakanensis]MTE19602.1 EamA family transporter [Streptomyces taklimakanensis]